MKMKSNKNSLLKCLRWTAANLAWSVMAFSPVALGKEAENISKQNLENFVKETGLNKKITLGEYWQKVKADAPAFLRKDLDAYIEKNKNLLMPEVVVKTVKGTDGKMVPVMQITENGKVNTAQFFGEKNKFVKYNNITLSELDLQRVTDVATRIEASDYNVKVAADAYRTSVGAKRDKLSNFSRDMARFSGFTRVTPQLWKALSMKERADMIITMRLMNQSAQKVLSLESGSMKPAAQGASIENYYKAIFADANAATKTKSAYVGSKAGESCVVAGYIGSYQEILNYKKQKSLSCSVDKGIESYKERAEYGFITQANQTCVSTKSVDHVACNPLIFGYPKGSPACVEKYKDEFSRATTSCDGQSRLSSSKLEQIPGKDYSKLMPREKQLEAIRNDQIAEKFELTENYLAGVLAAKNKSMAEALKDGKWSQGLEEMLSSIQGGFEGEIGKAIAICEQRIKNNPQQADPQQKDACDQLHRRWLFTEMIQIRLRKQGGCDANAVYVGSADKLDSITKNLCKCNDTGKLIALGEKCELSGGAVPLPAVPAAPEVSCASQYEGATGMNADCLCTTTNALPTEVVQSKNTNMENYPENITASSAPKYTCSNFDIPWKAVGIGALVALGLWWLFKKKTNDQLLQVQPPQVQQPAAPLCLAPRNPGAPPCTCGPCGAGFEVLDPNVCQCVPKPVIPGSVPVPCLNGSTAATEALCPRCPAPFQAQQVSMPSTQRPNGCPKPNEGNNGQNNNGGSGGVN
ncbi:MAG: hypothetical protein H7328_08360 [Bdellovibrio sp.]|nr:hypothetical protein [Bdellovibrio sp.]